MNIIEKLFEIRDEELSTITQKDKEELLKLYPKYYEDSNLETLVVENSKLKESFEEFCIKVSTETSFFNKKFYLAGLKDGLNIMKLAKGDDINDC